MNVHAPLGFSDTGIDSKNKLTPRQIFELSASYCMERAQKYKTVPTYWELGAYELAKKATQHIVFERSFLLLMESLSGDTSFERHGMGQDDTDHFLTFAVYGLSENIHLEYLMGYNSVFVCQEDSNEEVDFDQLADHPLLCGMNSHDLEAMLDCFRHLHQTGLSDHFVMETTIDYWEGGNHQQISPARKKHPEIFNLIDQKEMTAEVANAPAKKGRSKKI